MTERAQVGIVAVVGLVIGTLAAVVVPAQHASTGELNLIAHSAQTASEAGSARAEYTVTISMGAGAPAIGVTGDAAFDFANQAFAMTMDLDAPGASGFGTEIRLVDGVMYMRMPTGPGAPTPWISLDITEVAGEDALASLGTGSDVVQTLDYLRGAGNVSELGREDVRGVATTHYRADVDLRKALENAPAGQRAQLEAAVEQFELMAGTTSMPLDVWIDDAGLPRRMTYRVEIDGGPLGEQLPGDGSLAMFLSMDIFDYGQPVSVTAPPGSQVTDMTADLDQLSGLETF